MPTIAHYEMQNYPKSRWVRGHFFGTRKVVCAWADRVTLAVELGTEPDWAWPYPDGPSDCLAQEIKIEPYPLNRMQSGGGSPGILSAYEDALLTIEYQTLEGVVYQGTIVEEQLDPMVEMLTVNWLDLVWNDPASRDSLREGEEPQIPHYWLVYSRRYRGLSAIPSDVYDWVRYINSNTVATFILGRTFPPRTLLYVPPTVRMTWGIASTQKWDITYKFIYRPETWWKFWHNRGVHGGQPGHGAFDPIYTKNPGGKQFTPYPQRVF